MKWILLGSLGALFIYMHLLLALIFRKIGLNSFTALVPFLNLFLLLQKLGFQRQDIIRIFIPWMGVKIISDLELALAIKFGKDKAWARRYLKIFFLVGYSKMAFSLPPQNREEVQES